MFPGGLKMKREFSGLAVVDGISTGKVRIIDCSCPEYEIRKIDDCDRELGRFVRALKTYCENTRKQIEFIKKTLGTNESSILNSHIKMTHDLALQSELISIISNGMCAEEATAQVCDMYINRFLNADVEFVRQLAVDVMDVKLGVLNLLLGIEEPDVEHMEHDTIIVAKQLTPSIIARLDRNHTKGIVVEFGSPNSHGAILVKAMNIPAITEAVNIASLLKDGETVTIDGGTGKIYAE
jgi:phosphotransferase system enzyme I (PtsI)